MTTTYTLQIHPDGTVKKTVNGIEGPACLDSPLSRLLDRAYGTPIASEKTSDYYAQQTDTHVHAHH
jgi:hypothetical protein